MNWNSYDTKYIIKRLIIGFGMLILFTILTSNKAKAETSTTYMGSWQYNYTITNTSHGEIDIPMIRENNTYYQAFNGAGEGTIIFSVHAGNAQGGTGQIEEISIKNDNGTYTYTCEVGNMLSYTDNLQQRLIYTVKCPVYYPSGIGMAKVHIRTDGVGTLVVSTSKTATFVPKDNVNVNVNQQQVVNAITASQQATISAIQSAGTQAHQDAQQAHQDSQDIKNTITNDNITSSDADGFASNDAFSDTTGLESVINLPLNMVNSLSNQCVPIQIHIPYLETDATIPCMSTIYRSKFNNLYTLVKLVVNGFLVYRILLKVYELVHEAKQPDEDKLEVIEL